MALVVQVTKALKRILDINGTTDFTFSRESTSTLIDPLRPSKGYSKTTTVYTSKSMLTSYDRKMNIELNRSDGRDKTTVYMILYVDPDSIAIVPTEGDVVARGTQTFHVVENHPYEIAGTEILYEVTMMGG